MHRIGWGALAVALAAGLAGCGTPGAPLAPSLNLPEAVSDLAASRAGDAVTLTWTMPKRNTDKLLLKGAVPVRVCRKQGDGVCETVGGAANHPLLIAPGSDGSFTDTLPQSLTLGAPRMLSYFVELKNGDGRSAGLSNAAVVLAGVAPDAVEGLSVEIRKNGVVLHWNSESAAASKFNVRLHRRLLTPPQAKKDKQSLLAPPEEPMERNFLVASCAQGESKRFCRALDNEIHFGESYEYTAQRVARVTVDGKPLELAGPLSAAVRVDATDVFPPAVPTGLAAVANAAGATNKASIDLSWQPVTDTDLAGYAVYRRRGNGDWQRVSPMQPIVAPAFNDAMVEQGRTYHYAVSAVAQNGHESARSAEAQETVPGP